MKLFRKLLSAAMICGLVLAACGGDSDGNSLSVDKGKALSALSESEAQEVCEYAAKLMAGAITMEQACKQASVTMLAMGGKEGCQAAYDACMNPQGGDGGSDAECQLEGDLSGCTDVTVQHLLDCMDGMVAQQKQIANAFASLSCDSSVEDLAALEGLGDTEQPAACASLYEKCPAMNE